MYPLSRHPNPASTFALVLAAVLIPTVILLPAATPVRAAALTLTDATRSGPGLIIAGRDYPTIFSGTGDRRLRVTITTDAPAATARIRARIRIHESTSGEPSGKNTTTPPVAATRGQDLALPVNLPQPGLYEITVELLDTANATLATASTRVAAVPPRADIGPSDFGVCTHFAQSEAGRDPAMIPVLLDLARLAGFSRIRDEMYWNSIEKKAGDFQFLPRHDAYVAAAAERGISPLIALGYGNKSVYPETFAESKGFPESDAAREAYARYAEACVRRYGTRIKHWEIWNEPHAKSFGAATRDGYVRLLKTVYPRIKKVTPDAHIISCGGGGAGGGPGGDYISHIIKNGGLDSQDGFSIHPYMSPYPPERGYDAKNSPMPDGRVNIPTLSQHLSRLIGKNPKTDKKPLSLWITEIGWFTTRNLPWAKPEPAQAAALARMYLLARRHRTAEAIFWYDLRDDGTKPDDKEHNFGLIRNDYSPKPAYVAAAVLTATLGDRPWKTALHETGLAHIHQYGEGGNAVIAGWTVYSPASEVRHIKPAPGKYFLRDWQGHDKTVEIPATGYDWRLYPLPQYLVRDQ